MVDAGFESNLGMLVKSESQKFLPQRHRGRRILRLFISGLTTLKALLATKGFLRALCGK